MRFGISISSKPGFSVHASHGYSNDRGLGPWHDPHPPRPPAGYFDQPSNGLNIFTPSTTPAPKYTPPVDTTAVSIYGMPEYTPTYRKYGALQEPITLFGSAWGNTDAKYCHALIAEGRQPEAYSYIEKRIGGGEALKLIKASNEHQHKPVWQYEKVRDEIIKEQQEKKAAVLGTLNLNKEEVKAAKPILFASSSGSSSSSSYSKPTEVKQIKNGLTQRYLSEAEIAQKLIREVKPVQTSCTLDTSIIEKEANIGGLLGFGKGVIKAIITENPADIIEDSMKGYISGTVKGQLKAHVALSKCEAEAIHDIATDMVNKSYLYPTSKDAVTTILEQEIEKANTENRKRKRSPSPKPS